MGTFNEQNWGALRERGQRKEDNEPIQDMATCVDFSVAKGGVLRACRWNPGQTLAEAQYVDV